MINEKNVRLGEVRSCIRELFEYGKKRKAEIGEENVFDFSIGNPSVPPPEKVLETFKELLGEDAVSVHGYTSAQGDYSLRKALAEYSNSRYSLSLTADDYYITCGASAALAITFNALLNKGDEVIVFAPYFPEYRVFAENAGGKVVTANCDKKFLPDLDSLKRCLSDKTKIVVVNSPCNPSGVVLENECIQRLAEVLYEFEKSTGQKVYLVSDEPYREITYGKTPESFLNFYDRCVVCYSYSKCLSLAGDRIGYIAVNNKMQEHKKVYAAVCGAGRALGYVCAPSLLQKLILKCYDQTCDVNIYKRNRDMLYSALTSYGYEVVEPDGAVYLFVKALEPDAKKFAEEAKKFELLLVPSDDFGVGGYVRVAYCVAYDTIVKALPSFKALIKAYGKSV